ncbi:YXWGXW repeat-containing protein [Aquisphaera insulae]|uniref:YXWGXW repeat-containing protein n=1 Tax=Aquisphaera insulae TaxID=2712864 RepID=UPI0013ECA972|nr:YXWGXW repeat-containing protein [Aquisphaera insulae]
MCGQHRYRSHGARRRIRDFTAPLAAAMAALSLWPVAGTVAQAPAPPAPGFGAADDAGQGQGQGQTDAAGGQVLTRGPVHEAFAAPVVHDPAPGPVIPKPPPQPVEEMPPDEKPAGQNVQWIPGYWSWDQERNDYLWVSGVWREPPPGRQWVPGYWNGVAGGSRWVPGAWVPVSTGGNAAAAAAAGGGQAQYLPAPPASLENGPSSPSPGANVFWSPGSWFWQGDHYAWRPGFWAAVQPQWVWVPAHYVWTPGGFLFVEGFWDLPLAERGVLFAPVYYPQPVYVQPGFVFTPSITIATPGLVANLFVQPSFGQYCFGDFYAQSYLNVGIFPWFQFGVATGGPVRPVFYDPVFAFYASVNIGHNPGWAAQVRRDYIARRDHVEMRPPRTFVEQTRIVERNVTINRTVNVTHNVIGRPIREVAARGQAGGMRMERVSAEARQQYAHRGAELQQFRAERSREERQAVAMRSQGPGRPEGAAAGPRAMGLRQSPVAAPMHQQGGAGGGMPGRGHADSPAVAQGPGGRVRHEPQAGGGAPSHAAQGGRAMPHRDLDRSPAAGAGAAASPFAGHAAAKSADRPRLHNPGSFSERTPPAAPRPVQRQGGADRPRGEHRVRP